VLVPQDERARPALCGFFDCSLYVLMLPWAEIAGKLATGQAAIVRTNAEARKIGPHRSAGRGDKRKYK
jgi:hypothetical protein